MGRSAASIQTEITALESQLATSASAKAVGSDTTSLTQHDYKQISDRLDLLYVQLGRVNGTRPMFARTVVTGLR